MSDSEEERIMREVERIQNEPEDEEEYDLMLHLERLESLLEEMEELRVSSKAEVERKIQELHKEMDERE